MKRIFWGAVAVVLIELISTGSHAESPTRRADDVARAEELFRKGTEAFEAAQYSAAYAALRSAWDLVHGYKMAAGLGQVEIHLEQYRDAAEHLSFCLRHYPPDGDPAARAHVEQGLAQAREHVAAIRVRVSVEGAAVTVDDTSAGQSPLDGPIFVTPGSHIVAASLAGYRSAQETVEVSARMTRDVLLLLGVMATGAPADAPATAAVPVPAETTGTGRESVEPHQANAIPPATWVLLVGGALTSVALGTAVVFDVKSASAERDRENLRSQLGSSPDACVSPGAARVAQCSSLRDAGDRRDHDNQLATAFAIGTGVLAAGTLGTALLVHSSTSRNEATRFRPTIRVSVSPAGGGVFASGRF